MQLYSKQALVLGGLYTLLLYACGFLHMDFVIGFLNIIFFVSLIMLCCDERPRFVTMFIKKFPLSAYYVSSFGWLPYLWIVGFFALLWSAMFAETSSWVDTVLVDAFDYTAIWGIPVSLLAAFIRLKANRVLKEQICIQALEQAEHISSHSQILVICRIVIKLFGILVLAVVAGIDVLIVYDEGSYWFWIYATVVAVCIGALLVSFFVKIRKQAYIVFVVSLVMVISMAWLVPDIREQHGASACLDSEHGVWDYDEHRCRTDCWRWTRENGCEKE